jgi:hypothetical protein
MRGLGRGLLPAKRRSFEHPLLSGRVADQPADGPKEEGSALKLILP